MSPTFDVPDQSAQPDPPDQEPPSRRGRRPAPICEDVGVAHRGWLEPVRRRLTDSGLTLDELVGLSNYSKPRISELLRGKGLYPRWEITSSVGRALGAPMWPMRRLWANAAREAAKKQTWIERCIKEGPVLEPAEQPLDHQAFTDGVREPYTDFARAFLITGDHAGRVVNETFDILWLAWDQALASPNVQRFAWSVLRDRVVSRAAHHPEGHPDLSLAAFSTHAHALAGSQAARLNQVQESIDLFHAISQLPHNSMDTTVLRYLCGVAEADIPRILGVTRALADIFDHHARQILDASLTARDDQPGETAS